jgi:hypothetical protein
MRKYVTNPAGWFLVAAIVLYLYGLNRDTIFYEVMLYGAGLGAILAWLLLTLEPNRPWDLLALKEAPTSPISFANVATPVVIVGGIVIYAILSASYEAFYRALNTTSIDVGLNYSTVLAGSTGQVVLILFMSMPVAAAYFIVTSVSWRTRIARYKSALEPPDRAVVHSALLKEARIIFLVVLVLVTLGQAKANILAADRFSRKVRRGEAVDRIGPYQWLLVMPLKATPATLVSTDESPSQKTGRAAEVGDACRLDIAGLKNERLLYLGTANSMYVLYDPRCQTSIEVSTASAVLHIGP